MLDFKPLLAADWVEIAIVVFIMTSSLIGQLYKAVQKQQKKKRQIKKKQLEPAHLPPARPEPRRPEPRRGEPVAGPPAVERKNLEDEIEAFLRKSLGGKEPPKEAPVKPPPPRRVAPQRTPQHGRQRKPVAASDPDFPAQESVGEHVERHIESQGMGRRDAHLGEMIGQADERLETHLTQVFEHRLGNLREQSIGESTSIGQGTDAAYWNQTSGPNELHQRIFELLSTPQNVQAAVLLSEILRRPDDPWS